MVQKGFQKRVCNCIPVKASTRKPIQKLGSPVRVKASIVFFQFIMMAAWLPGSEAQNTASQPVTTTELAAWLTGGVSSSRLARLSQERGLANLPTHSELRQMESIGAGKDLMRVLSSGNVRSAAIGPAIPELLLRAASEAREERFHQ